MSKQRGSALVMTTLFSLVLMGFAALAVDVGRSVATRTRLQRVADAAALAGCKDLPNGQANATAAALDFAGRNGVALTAGDVSFPSASSVRVALSRPVSTLFARVMGIQQLTVPAAATAAALSATSTQGLRPWGIAARDFQDYTTGVTYKLKLTSKSGEYTGGGNFQAVDLDGGGANGYRNAIINGSQTRYSVGDSVPTETGNMTGPTKQGLDDLIGGDAHGSYAAALAANEVDCSRLVTIIVIRQSSFGSGKTSLVIDGFATFFLTSYKSGEVTGQFVRYVDMNATSDGSPAGIGTQAIALVN
jgi:hypothetical protein